MNRSCYFDSNQVGMLEQIDVKLSDGKEHTDDELDDIYDTITLIYQCSAFNINGNLLPTAYEWERIIDIFF